MLCLLGGVRLLLLNWTYYKKILSELVFVNTSFTFVPNKPLYDCQSK